MATVQTKRLAQLVGLVNVVRPEDSTEMTTTIASTKQGMVVVTSNQREFAIGRLSDGASDQPWLAVVPSERLLKLFEFYDTPTLDIQPDTKDAKKWLVIKYGKKTNRIECLSDNLRSSVTKEASENFANVSGEDFYTLFRSVVYAASSEAMQPAWKCVQIELVNGELRLSATDGFRAAVNKVVDVESKGGFRVHVEAHLLRKYMKFLRESSLVTIAVDDSSKVSFKFGDMSLTVVATEAVSADLFAFVEATPKNHFISFNMDDMQRTARLANVLSPRRLKLEVSSDSCKMSCHSDDGGDITSSFDVDSSWNGDIYMNPKFLKDAAVSADGNVRMFLLDDKKPITFAKESYPHWKYVVAPMYE